MNWRARLSELSFGAGVLQVTDTAALQFRLGIAALGQRQFDVQLCVLDEFDALVRQTVMQFA